ncbi:MAG: exodeoxyribonuclease VII large subunit [Candidatus Binataceae bacterium]|nr:exodeoxyribonuclease VII large subunit [Candidatus Binataceae bacterium]
MDEQLALTLKSRRPSALSVTQLVRAVRETLELNLDECWVIGEISNARPAASGHFYCTLKDAACAINVVMFRTAYRRVRFRIDDGIKVVVRGRVSLYEGRGTLQFYAEEIQPRGLGALQLAFEQLKERLQKEGLFDPEHKRPPPFLPCCIGIVTALRGAALRDMLTILEGRFPNLHLIIRPTAVQGEGAAAAIAMAIADLNRDGRAEVIIAGRGGGSLEDLWAFNEEAVARAIYTSKVPVISAVGHEIDFTIADFTADLRAPTPTAAAQMVIPIKAELKLHLSEISNALDGAMKSVIVAEQRNLRHFHVRLKDPRGILRQAGSRVDEAAAALEDTIKRSFGSARDRVGGLGGRLRGPGAMIREYRRTSARLTLDLARGTGIRSRRVREGVEKLSAALADCGRGILEQERRRLATLATRLDVLSPLRCLERGYAVVVNRRNGQGVSDAGAVEIGDELDIRLKRGRLRARATFKEA